MKLFNKVPISKVKKSMFDLSYENKLTCNFGKLYPVFWEETLPGDKIKINTQALLKLAPMQFPIMHNVNVHFYSFWLPTRTIFEDFEKFMTGGKDGLETVVHPNINLLSQDFVAGTLADYLGINSNDATIAGSSAQNVNVSSLPFRAYHKIWNEYFRDQNLVDELQIPTTPGTETGSNYALLTQMRSVAWEKDYFTASLPWPQKGQEVLIPMESDVTYKGTSEVYNADGSINTLTNQLQNGTQDTNTQYLYIDHTTTDKQARIENIDTVSNATANIESLRRSIVIQQWLEKLARGGSRMVEFVRTMFNTIIPDYRVQRPEFLGSSKQSVMISEVLATFQNSEWAQGSRAGTGFSLGQGHGFNKFFPEHGIVMTLMAIKPRTGYFQGINRKWFKLDRFSYPWPDFAHIGEQEVLNKELYYNTTDGLNENVFGYVPRYSEYKYRPNEVHGEFKTTLDAWHLDRKFANRPGLNQEFITCDPDDERIWAVTDQNTHHFYVSVYHNIKAIRPLPYFGFPKL